MKIFIAHSHKDREIVDDIIQLLRGEGHQVSSQDYLGSVSNLIADIPAEIRSAEVLIAVLTSGSPNVLYELGLAAGSGIPTLVTAPSSELLPASLVSAPYVPLTGDHARDARAIAGRLKELRGLASPAPYSAQSASDVLKRAVESPDYLETLSASAFEGLVAQLFVERGYDVAEFSKADDGGADFAIRDKDDGGIVLVEIKKLSRHARVSVDAVARLRSAVTSTDATLGILLSTAEFTAAAQALAAEGPILLRTLDDVVRAQSVRELAKFGGGSLLRGRGGPGRRVDFLVSYNKADRAWAEWIAWRLEQAGYDVRIQAWDFGPGASFVREIERAAAEAERTIAVLSPDYLKSTFTASEWAAAFALDARGNSRRLVPVRVRQCNLEGFLPSIVYTDLLNLNEDAASRALLTGVARGRAKPDLSPAFPGPNPRPLSLAKRFPGTLPPVWNVPHLRNPFFTGRTELLDALVGALSAGPPEAMTVAITGLGGVGKTQLAVEYAYRFADQYDCVWWLRAEEPATLADDYAGLASCLNLPELQAQEQEVAIAAVRAWLERNRNWLLVFDNVEQREAIRSYLPQSGGHVVITTRDPNWGGVARALPMSVWTREEAAAFLLKRVGESAEQGPAAERLAEALGDLPVALEQAGAYMEATGESLEDYRLLFERERQQLFEDQNARPASEYQQTVATTWNVAFERAREEIGAAADLLHLSAFLGADAIPRKLLAKAPALGEPIVLNQAIAALRRYSLVQTTEDSLTFHRLVQAVTRDRLGDADRRKFAEIALRLVEDEFPFDSHDVRTWPECARLLPHGLAAAEHTEALAVAAEATGWLLNRMGMYLIGRAEFAQARAAFERALKIEETAYGPDHPEVATTLNNLGSVLWDLGDLAGARAAFERALELGEAAYGPDHPAVAIRVNNLGNVLRDLGDLAGARAAFERVLKIDEAAYGPDHPDVATAVNNLGNVLGDLGDLAGARAAYERAVKIDEAAYGPEHPEVAIDVSNLAAVLEDLGDLAGARVAYERALIIFERSLGREHPNTLRVERNLRILLHEVGEILPG